MTRPSGIRQAVILAAGFGSRLRPITDSLPKAMVPIGGKPLLEHHVERLRRFGVREFFVNLHHLPDVIRNHFGDGSRWGARITYAQEPEIRGTAGGLKSFESELDDAFFVLYGDVFSLLDYRRMAEAFLSRRDAVGMELVGATDHPLDSDLVELDEDQRFLRIHPKPHRTLPARSSAMRGVFVLGRRILSEIPAEGYFEIDHHLLPRILERGERFYGYLSDEYTKDVGTPERYREVDSYCRSLRAGFPEISG